MGAGDFPKVIQTRVAAGQGHPAHQEQPRFTLLSATGFRNPSGAPRPEGRQNGGAGGRYADEWNRERPLQDAP